MLRKLNSLFKDLSFATGFAYIFYPFRKLLLFLSNWSELTNWIHQNKRDVPKKDFFIWKRNYDRRLDGFSYIIKEFNLENDVVNYFEFGVASGASFEWWLNHLKNSETKFFGFDTFEGLPEDWGLFYKKGAMSHSIREITDDRHIFVKGIFQDTLTKFIDSYKSILISPNRKIIHMDADLFSATLFVLTQMYPYLHKGDIIVFDEFNVPNHEFYAVKLFQDCFYVKLKPVCALNNFYQTIFIVI